MSAVDGVEQVSEPQWNPDRSALLDGDPAREGPRRRPAAAGRHRTLCRTQQPGLDIRQAGDITIDDSINERVADDLSAAEMISLPVTLILMLLAFGALIAAGIPVLLAATSVAATIGIMAPLSYLVPSEPTVGSMIVLIGMAVGVDYSLFYLKREREERAKGRTTLDAVEIAAETSGHSILVSGGAVIASMAGLYVIGDATFNSLATGAIIVVAVAVLGSITVLPALLAKLGRWVDRPRVPLLWRLNRRIGQGGISRRILAPVTRRPVAALAVSGAIVVLLALPALGMKIHSGNLADAARRHPRGADVHGDDEGVPGRGHDGRGGRPGIRRRPGRGGRGADPARPTTRWRPTTSSRPVATRSRCRRTARRRVLQLAMPYDESDERVDRAIEDLRADLAPAALDDLGAEYAVGGGAAESLDFVNQQRDRLPLVIGVVLLLTLLMMVMAFRSIPIALVSTLLNLASVGAAFGILTLVFQHGWGADALDFTSPGFVIDWIPLFVMVVLVGPVDGLPRVRAQPDPRVRPQRAAHAARGGARHQRHGGRGHQCGGRHGLGVRDLRDAEHDGDEDDGRRPVGRDPARRDRDPAGDAARDPGPPGREGLVARPPGTPGGGAGRGDRAGVRAGGSLAI